VRSMHDALRLYGLEGSREYAFQIAKVMGVQLTPHREEYFDDGEAYIQSDSSTYGNVRGCDVFVVQSLYSNETESIADRLQKLLIFIGSLKDASATRITAVIPYLGYSRQDRKTESRAPITTKYIAQQFEAVGCNRILTLDVHNLSAEQNAFRTCRFDHLEAKTILAEYVADNLESERIAVLSPDAGGYLRAHLFRNKLAKLLKRDIEIVQLDKVRVNRKVIANRIVGDVKGVTVIPYDDMIASGGTLSKAVDAVHEAEGEVWGVLATHGLFVGSANEKMANPHMKRIIVCDTIEPFRLNDEIKKKVHLVPTTHLFGEAIRRIHEGTGSLSELLR
jgi:ribose-phosphate pyrophosphokinase